MRSPEEIERATDIYCQLHYLSVESLNNLLHSVIAEAKQKGGFSKELKAAVRYALNAH